MRESTYINKCPPQIAQIMLSGLILFAMLGLFEKPTAISVSSEGMLGDIRIYQNVVDRMRQGESYYSAAENELRPKYALRPFWSFRLPTLAFFLSLFRTNLVPMLMLTILTTAMVFFWLKILLESCGWISVFIGTILLSFSMTCVVQSSNVVWHDLWAGILIALSLGLYNTNRILSVIFGLLALTLRIHVVPFILVMGFFALSDKRLRESIIWFGSVGLFVIYVAIHAYFVSKHVTDADPTKTWTSFGGWPFVISTTRWTLPGVIGLSSISSVLLPVSLLSLAVLQNTSARRASGTMLLYCLAFMIMGNPNNDYWGLLYSPLWAVGVACAPKTIKELCFAACVIRSR
jgi:hypothetical protein